MKPRKRGLLWKNLTEAQKAAVLAWFKRPMVAGEYGLSYRYFFNADGSVSHAEGPCAIAALSPMK